MINTPSISDDIDGDNERLFSQIAMDLRGQGYSVCPEALPGRLGEGLVRHLNDLSKEKFNNAGVGRKQELAHNNLIRGDEICWITGESIAGREWLEWIAQMKAFLNRQLFLGLFSFESHFSHYAAGDFYKRHSDAFKGEANRILSLVVYLNSDWKKEDAGELILYEGESDTIGISVPPRLGTVVVFLSEEFPHEVSVTHSDRYSIAGWFRINSSITECVDPPL